MDARGTGNFNGELAVRVHRPWWRRFTVPIVLLLNGKDVEFLSSVGLSWAVRLINYFRSI